MQGEAREETRNKNKTSGESPRGTALPVILSLVSMLQASHFFNLIITFLCSLMQTWTTSHTHVIKELNDLEQQAHKLRDG